MGVTVSPSLPNSRYVRNYWEVSACGSGASGRQPPQTGSQNAPPPPPPSAAAFDCRCPTMANSYLTADVAQPRGWQRPVAIPWQKGVTANDCYRKCVENRGFPCRAFVLEEHPSFGAQCWISSLDRATGVTVSPSSPDSRYVRNYWELDACRSDRQCAAQEPAPSPTGACRAPTLANAYLTADVRQPAGWERPVAIPWQKGITANDCYRKCVENRDFKCRAFVLEQHPSFGAQCWISSLDRAGGVTVSPSLASSNYIRNYWEVRDCQPGGSGPAAPPPVSATGPGPAQAAPAGCADPRTLGFMDEWLARAVPVPAGAYRFDNWGRIIGQNDSTRVRNINQPVDPYTWATRCDYLWSIAASMYSRNLGTMLNYVQGRLAGR